MARKSNRKGRGVSAWIAVLLAVVVAYSVNAYKKDGKIEIPHLETNEVVKNITEHITSENASNPKDGEIKGEEGEHGIALPAPLDERNEHIIHHKGYIVSYNSDWKIPNWVAWELTAYETKAKMPREDTFCEDPDYSGPQASLDDYRKSGYSRGHMAPAADMRWNHTALLECFYLTNMCPQNAAFNAGNWGQLEKQCREWAKSDSAIWIVCGPIVGKSHRTIGKNQVVVPTAFFKVVMAPYGKHPKAVGFIYPHRNQKGAKMRQFMMSVDQVEARTGIDFFASLPDKLENKIEAQNPAGHWWFSDERSNSRQRLYR